MVGIGTGTAGKAPSRDGWDLIMQGLHWAEDSPAQLRPRLEAVLPDHAEVFGTGKGVPCAKVGYHKFDTGDHAPVRVHRKQPAEAFRTTRLVHQDNG